MTVHKNFRPSCYDGTGKIEPLAVTLDAGVQLYEMYEFLQSRSVMVVGGSSHGVGAVGGYIQGGGHSMFAGLLGMAYDNALEFKVVVADVSFSSCCKPTSTNTKFRVVILLQILTRIPICSGLFVVEVVEHSELLLQ